MRLSLLSAGLIVCATLAHAEEKTFSCTEKAQGGFFAAGAAKETTDVVTLTPRKMKVVLDDTKMTATLFGMAPETYVCRKAYLDGKRPELVQCQENTYFMVFNTSDGRFVRSQMFGYVGNKLGAPSDSLTVSYGDCE